MTTRIKIKKGAGTPSGLTFGELAYDLTNKKLFIGITGGNALLANTDGGVAQVNGATGSVTTYAGTTGNIQFRYGSGVTANNYFGLTVGSLGQITDTLTLSGVTVGFDAYYNGNNEALGLQFERGVFSLGMDEAGGVAISAKGIYDEGGPYLYGASLYLTTPSGVDNGSNIYFRAAGNDQFLISPTSVLSNAPHLFGFGINSYAAGYTNFFEGPITGVTATFTGLVSASKGISAAGGVTFNGTVASDTGYRITSNAINAQTGTTYTFIAADNGKVLTFNNGSAVTVTIPTALPVGFNCTAIQLGAGQVGFTAASGLTLQSYGNQYRLIGQHAAASIIEYSANIVNLSGNLVV